jgi:hypothetical protein
MTRVGGIWQTMFKHRLLVCGGTITTPPRFCSERWMICIASINFETSCRAARGALMRWPRIGATTHPDIVRWECKAEWKKYGPAAGPIRNQRMLDWGPDLVVAFSGGKGTADMVRRARAAGVEVIEP